MLLVSLAHMIHDIYSSFLAPILPLLIEKLNRLLPGINEFFARCRRLVGDDGTHREGLLRTKRPPDVTDLEHEIEQLEREKDAAVLITAHTFKHWDTGLNEIVGGDAIKYWSKVMVYIEKTGRMSERKATLIKHRYLPEWGSVKFSIVNEGIKPAGFKIFKK